MPSIRLVGASAGPEERSGGRAAAPGATGPAGPRPPLPGPRPAQTPGRARGRGAPGRERPGAAQGTESKLHLEAGGGREGRGRRRQGWPLFRLPDERPRDPLASEATLPGLRGCPQGRPRARDSAPSRTPARPRPPARRARAGPPGRGGPGRGEGPRRASLTAAAASRAASRRHLPHCSSSRRLPARGLGAGERVTRRRRGAGRARAARRRRGRGSSPRAPSSRARPASRPAPQPHWSGGAPDAAALSAPAPRRSGGWPADPKEHGVGRKVRGKP